MKAQEARGNGKTQLKVVVKPLVILEQRRLAAI